MSVGIERNRLLECFSASAREALVRLAREARFADGGRIFDEGLSARSVYCLGAGRVRLIKRSSLGSTVIGIVEPGDYFGEIGAMHASAHIASAWAEGDVVLFELEAAEFRRVLADEPPEATRRLSSRLLEYLRAIDEKYVGEVVHKEKLQLIGELARSIIHDFKNPLASILLAGGMIKIEHPDEQTRKYCTLIERQSHRMAGMAQELLDFAKGTPELKKERVSMRDLFADFRLLNEGLLKAARVQLVADADDAEVRIDRNRFLRVLQNLVGNAVDAMASTGGTVRLSGRRAGERPEFVVQDHRPGVPEPVRERIFQPFATYGKPNGMGLGLAIAKGVVEAHGGTIELATETGRGTTIHIRLPDGD
ncbi:MAG: ATP-binding protein [Elusimicrobia bacterium]|nr:ATP-binding protein [Elusimicrobiota bacterium]